jgi:hypothetical protein
MFFFLGTTAPKSLKCIDLKKNGTIIYEIIFLIHILTHVLFTYSAKHIEYI